MALFAQTEPRHLTSQMRAFIGRHTDKSFDWDAFPGSQGFPELARAQMRYIGAGGSPPQAKSASSLGACSRRLNWPTLRYAAADQF